MSKIIYTESKKLYLGDMFDANNDTELTQNKISTIICVAEGVKVNQLSNTNIQVY